MAEPRRMIAVAFGPPSMREAISELPRIRAAADCVELRLDLFQSQFDLPLLLGERHDLPVVVTLRPPEQGGKSPLPPAERLQILLRAAELGAEYIDVEYEAATPDAVAQIKHAGAQLIVSRHDFENMPAELEHTWWDDLANRGADVVKVVGTATNVCDCLPTLRVLQRASLPTIAIAMGSAGLLSRILALRSEQCLLTYAALDADQGTAPGQLSVSDMRDVYRAGRIGSQTKVFGLLGPHLERDRLAEYNRWFADDAVDAVAVPFQTHADAPAIVSAYRKLPVAGWHIHGEELQRTVGQALDELSPGACRQGKVNAIVQDASSGLEGHWVESPREQYELWRSAA
ncbi:MAG TPA: type I 3-dehydroquinate dehydratase [Chloroflexota bacterium]|jgi:3-dehydroquinate dehydratase/shikimate dehydrogenase|nr:type I 3-dehydroquinate dehydratase [Chloroflexota bacterium]